MDSKFARVVRPAEPLQWQTNSGDAYVIEMDGRDPAFPSLCNRIQTRLPSPLTDDFFFSFLGKYHGLDSDDFFALWFDNSLGTGISHANTPNAGIRFGDFFARAKIEYPSTTPVTGDLHVEYLPVVNRSPLPFSPDFLEKQETHILIRGDINSPGLRVDPGWHEVLGTIPSELKPTPRQALAEWLSNPENPLVARVWVNRIWQMHFGRGLVATPGDFGTHGEPPSHPELLDWLASEPGNPPVKASEITRDCPASGHGLSSSAFTTMRRSPSSRTVLTRGVGSIDVSTHSLVIEAISNSLTCVVDGW